MIYTPIASTLTPAKGPSVDKLKEVHQSIQPYIRRTPLMTLDRKYSETQLGLSCVVSIKFELFQVSGTFKARAAFFNLMNLSEAQKQRGVTTVSGGNHAIAVATAAKAFSVPAKICMAQSTDPYRVAKCRQLGSEVILCDDVHHAFEKSLSIEELEGLTYIPPFEGEEIACGTGTLGLEIIEEVPNVENVVVSIGGGGLAGGLANAVKQLKPDARIYGVEPIHANTMTRSFQSGTTEKLTNLNTIADTLAAPYSEPYSCSLCQQYIDGIVNIEDSEMLAAMHYLYDEFSILSEPAGSAALAAAIGPLREELKNGHTVIIMCGSNISLDKFSSLLERKNP